MNDTPEVPNSRWPLILLLGMIAAAWLLGMYELSKMPFPPENEEQYQPLTPVNPS